MHIIVIYNTVELHIIIIHNTVNSLQFEPPLLGFSSSSPYDLCWGYRTTEGLANSKKSWISRGSVFHIYSWGYRASKGSLFHYIVEDIGHPDGCSNFFEFFPKSMGSGFFGARTSGGFNFKRSISSTNRGCTDFNWESPFNLFVIIRTKTMDPEHEKYYKRLSLIQILL